MRRLLPFVSVLLVTILLAFAVACGGGGKSHVVSGVSLTSGSPAPQDAIEEGGFELLFAGDLKRESFSMTSEELATGEVKVSISAVNANDLPYAMFELLYDAARYNPVSVEFDDFFGTEEVISTGITTRGGNVGLAVVPERYLEKSGVSGSGPIVSVTFETAPYRTVSVNDPPGTEYPEDEVLVGLVGLDIDGNVTTEPTLTVSLGWSERLLGDGDLNGDVAIADVAPVAASYLAVDGDPEYRQVIDYDGNGDIAIADVAVVAKNYLNVIGGYNVYWADNEELTDPTLDGSQERATPLPDPPLPGTDGIDDGGYLEYEYTMATDVPGGASYYFYVVPFDGDTPPDEPDPLVASAAIEVGETIIEVPHLFNGFIIEVDNPGWVGPRVFRWDDVDPTIPDFIANESYTFTLTGANVSPWDEATQTWLTPIDIDDTHALWNFPTGSDWYVDIAWVEAPVGPGFAFASPTGSPVVGTAGPDDPFSFTVTSTLEAIDLVIGVDVGIDPTAPELVAVLPDEIDVVNFGVAEIQLFCNTNDALGTLDYEFELIAADDLWNPGGDPWWPPPADWTLDLALDPGAIKTGEFVVEDFEHPEFGTLQVVRFKIPTDVSWGVYRFGLTNALGKTSSINHPPAGGTVPTSLVINTTNVGAQPFDIRTYPVVTGDDDEVSRVMIYPDNPRVQKYPSIVLSEIAPPDDRTALFIRDDGFGDFFTAYTKTGFEDPLPFAPYAHVYTEDPWTGSTWDPKPGSWVGTSNAAEAFEFDIPLTFDWKAFEWLRLVIDTTNIPVGNGYFIAVWVHNAVEPVAKGTFDKSAFPPPPPVDPPVILGIADAEIVFDDDRDGVLDSAWPVLEYPDVNGVLINPSVVTYPSIFLVGNLFQPDVYFDFGPGNEWRGTYLTIYDGTGNFKGDVVPRHHEANPDDNILISTVRSYKFDPAAPDPPALPGIGDPAVVYVDEEAGWMIIPLDEIDPFILDGLQFKISLNAWNKSTQTPLPGPMFDMPFTLQP